jgi:hypothetical protein
MVKCSEKDVIIVELIALQNMKVQHSGSEKRCDHLILKTKTKQQQKNNNILIGIK